MSSTYFINKILTDEKTKLAFQFLSGYIAEKLLNGILEAKADSLETPELLARQLYEALDGAFEKTCKENNWVYDDHTLLSTLSNNADLWSSISSTDDLIKTLGIAVGNEYSNILSREICEYWIDVFNMEVACRQQLYNYLMGHEIRKTKYQVGELVKERYYVIEKGTINGIGDVYFAHDKATGKVEIIRGENKANEIIGMTINNRYTVVEHLGKGGFGNVYKGFDYRLKRNVAIKVFFDCPVSWNNELNILKNIKHKSLTYVNDVIEISDNCLAIVMDYVQGENLMTIIEKSGPLSLERAVSVLKQICDALCYLHETNPQIIHGDIKPNNLIMSPIGDITLIDFNLSQITNGLNIPIGRTDGYSPPEFYLGEEWNKRQFSAKCTSVAYPHDCFDIDFPYHLLYGAMAGKYNSDVLFYAQTPEEMSQYHFDSVVSIRSDIYSLGATVFFIMTGKHPWPKNIVENELETVDLRIAAIINHCMQLNPYDRYSSVREILQIIHAQF